MRKLIIYNIVVLSLCITTSCDNGFDELNTSKVNATELNPILQLNFAVINSSFYTGDGGGTPIIYDMAIVQQLVTPNSGVVSGGNYNQDNRDASSRLWQNYYRNVIRNTRDVIRLTQGSPERSNLYNMSRIFQAYGFMVLTDTYGDIPYFQAGQAYPNRANLFPEYDPQENIYTDIIKELTEASAAITTTGNPEPIDLLFGGDMAKWKRFGYSLLLRAGMRLSKVAPDRAALAVQAAFQGGVMTSNADNALIKHDANYPNTLGNTLNGSESSSFYLAAPFVNQLKSTNDPRLESIAIRYKGASSGAEQTVDRSTKAAADQVGMPMGYDGSTIKNAVTALGLKSFYDFSQVDRRRMAKRDAPMFLVTYAQTQLLLAEARYRGWITTGTAEDYYQKGVRAHMEQLATYDVGAAVPEASIQPYLDNNPLVEATALEQINTQYWIASFMNAPETFANFRRSGFPQLAPNPYPGKTITGSFIRRITYPNSEISVNNENVKRATDKMGPDNLDTHVWWDSL
ncbi:SusD/RagB family nutrient-binding outer membrane lipoprotein [Chryseosolibacter indicus]|uniref:SusD/RagB family nutrient-binding outer membrane lipoprotein n=1 Tax=Chryseosolibacter indicus TaxID=2782351 RepID=A0ABS5VQF5_9BACT|nr:SusD/RagB family nutrient-binding outer membrane lipoprotein [Chryseosolibacter indicus]MBT1703667.1 SusD/RagB family nutrient-binding outer membrane lipoprotein [Chryseosolibacter indicus]